MTAPLSPDTFHTALHALTAQLAGRPLDADLEAWLHQEAGPGSAAWETLAEHCRAGVQGGWLCTREGGGLRYGRLFKPADALQGFSVDVVDMADIAGPHHRHPTGEIDLIVPIDADARFDGRGAGWLVYPPGSAHAPTVSGGRALVLYLLPQGQIDFTRAG